MAFSLTLLRRPLGLLTACFALFGGLGCTGSPTTAPSSTLQQLQKTAQEPAATQEAMNLVKNLTLQAAVRPAGSAGYLRAVEWAEAAMRELGLENVHTEPVTDPQWVRRHESGEVLTPYPQPLHLTALGGSVSTPPEGLVAEVLEVPTLAALRALPAGAAHGKFVFINHRMERRRDGSGYGPVVAGRGAGASAAAEKGAVGLLIRSVATSNARFPHTGGMRYTEGVPQIPAAALAMPDADLLANLLAQGKPVTVRLRLEIDRLADVTTANVIGEVRGREKPEEIVVLGAHLDAWDLSPGALDDGAGCAIVLAAAAHLARLPERPRRTVRVVLFANEEFGLTGARAYAAAHQAELARHVIAAESDFGAGRVWRFSSRVAPDAVPRMQELARQLAPLGIEWGDNEAGGGADLGPLAPAGVPVVSLSQDGTTYFDYHHSADDTLDKINPAELAQNVAAMASFAWFAAEDPEGFGRVAPPAER